MITNAPTAKQVSDLMLRVSRELEDSLDMVKKASPAEEFAAYRLAVGKIMADILLEMLNPLYAKHPSLKPPGFK